MEFEIYTHCTNPYGLPAMEYKNKIVSTNFSSDALFPYTHVALCLALLWSFRKPKFTHLQYTLCVSCICTLTEAVHLIQGAVALATEHFQIDSDGKEYCLFSLLSILSLLKTINTTYRTCDTTFHDFIISFLVNRLLNIELISFSLS